MEEVKQGGRRLAEEDDKEVTAPCGMNKKLLNGTERGSGRSRRLRDVRTRKRKRRRRRK